ncbi:MAG: non-homologous end-joining DNA ligase [Actinomycetota bacterium]
MLATLTHDYFSDPDWIFELKLDGVRCLTFKQGNDVRMLSRNKIDRSGHYPAIAKAIARQTHDFVIDGEVAAIRGGRTSFALLQQAYRMKVPIVYFVFDIVYLDGKKVARHSLLERKAMLKKALSWRKSLQFVDHITGDGEDYHAAACEQGLEGVIAKRAASRYVHGRSNEWLKFKCTNEQELVIGGYTDPQGSRAAFGALLVGYYEGKQLRYAGKVGTGFDAALLRSLLTEMKPLERDVSPFADKLPARKNVHWLKPELVAQVGFAEWTSDGRLRHPRFVGIRRDKKASQVRRES